MMDYVKLPSPFGDEVSLWLLESCEGEACLAWLSENERARYAAFHKLEDARLFALSHVMQREILAREVGKPPGSLVFGATLEGKPFLEGEEIFFNLSHARNYALLGMSRAGPLGVDVEEDCGDVSLPQIAPYAFSKEEEAFLHQVPEGDRSRRFLEMWTGKEAVLKALGVGIGSALQDFSVLPELSGLVLRSDKEIYTGVSVRSLSLPYGLVGAVARLLA